MEANGWSFDSIKYYGRGTVTKRGGYRCKTDTFWGWASVGTVGTASVVLKGDGTGTLGFGNCFTGGNVKVYLNDQLLKTAGTQQFPSITFSFSEGDVLRITEDFAIMQLNSLELFGKYE